MDIQALEQQIADIKARNSRVEQDKAWETSKFRKLVIAILTYVVITIVFIVAKLPDPFLNSIVPSIAFVISTLSLTLFKKLWETKIK